MRSIPSLSGRDRQVSKRPDLIQLMQARNPQHSSNSDKTEGAAASWLACCDRGLSADEQVQFQRWLAADPRHRAAWREIKSIWREFDAPHRSGVAGGMICELAARRRRRRWKTFCWAATALAASVTVAFILEARLAPVAPLVTEQAISEKAVVSEPEHRVLPDGSVIELNAEARVEVDYRPTERRVRLLRGVAHFAVAKNAARPFVVTAGTVEVRAVGTAFAVRLKAQAVDVLVTEGRVVVDCPAVDHAPVPPPIFVSAGSRILVPVVSVPGETLQVTTLPEAEIERWFAWRDRHFELSSTPLAEAVGLLNRENRVQVYIADAELAEMRLSGIFRANNAEGFVRLLESNYGVQVERRGENEIILRKAPRK